MARDYKKEYKDNQSSDERKKYRAELRKERVKRGLTDKDGTANGNGKKHIAHSGYYGKGSTSVQGAKKNLKNQPKRK